MDGAISLIQLLVNADDFGYSRGVNYGIMDAHKHGIVNSTTMLMNMQGTDQAIELAKENPDLKVGVHLTLTCGKALAPKVPSLTSDDGTFRMTRKFERIEEVRVEDVEMEWSAQIEAFLQTGLVPTHMDSHHHIHGQSKLLSVVKRLSEKYGLPVRNVFGDKKTDLRLLTDIFLADFYKDGVHEGYFDELQNRVKGGTSVEVMCHPAYVDEALLNGSSYHVKRADELTILMNTKLNKEKIQLL
ncbi:chitin disaccharide deacetylase [Pseudalkalibacillus berkeleyi]|uniref:Chitin disaccharide deacetylase n=1 Tax=Pseudalkalibacillus berkeleyi TaxID=1069813 RepID=A0ABS9H3Q6_9BACL|nr:chitin disaccharide deacetylase [Pseudalkalibacillus berkeleyi]MCF6138498.1 chitin disaccharide deacetylase [Pseudalkalibacillus berkeleyi]